MLLEEVVDGSLEHERVVDRNVRDALLQDSNAHEKAGIVSTGLSDDINIRREYVDGCTYDLVPTGLSPSGDGLVHHVVSDKEVRLQLFEADTTR